MACWGHWRAGHVGVIPIETAECGHSLLLFQVANGSTRVTNEVQRLGAAKTGAGAKASGKGAASGKASAASVPEVPKPQQQSASEPAAPKGRDRSRTPKAKEGGAAGLVLVF